MSYGGITLYDWCVFRELLLIVSQRLWFPFIRSTLETLNLHRSRVNMGQPARSPSRRLEAT